MLTTPSRESHKPDGNASAPATPKGRDASAHVNPVWTGLALAQGAPLPAIRIAAGASDGERQAGAVARRAVREPFRGRAPAREDGASRTATSSPFASDAGTPLDANVRDRVEPLVGGDLGAVRVHADPRARHTASALGARAFTLREHIHLGPGERASDLGLMAHEAAHAVQQPQPGPMLLQRDATTQSITPSYAAALDDGSLMFEMQMVESALRHQKASDDTHQVLTENLATLRDEYSTRSPGANTEAEPTVSEMEPPRVTEIPEGGTGMGRMGVVAWDGEPPLRLRSMPDTESSDNIIATLPFATRLLVIKSFPGNWYFVSTPTGDLGYVASNYIFTDLPEPNARLHRVTPGIPGTAIAIAERYYGEYADDWGQDLRFYVNVLAWANHISVLNYVLGWRDVHFKAGQLIWVPSQRFAYSLRGTVNSGSLSYTAAEEKGLTLYAERAGQLWNDYSKALSYSGEYQADAIARHVEQTAQEMVDGLITMIKLAVAILAISTAVGALIGAFFGGVGAVPGAVAGFEVGLVILEWLGLAMLLIWVGKALLEIGADFGRFLAAVWTARGDEEKLQAAGFLWAEAIAKMIATLLEGLVMVVAMEGLPRGLALLRGTRFGGALGETRGARWLTDRAASVAKGESPIPGPGALMRGLRGTGRPGAEPATMVSRGRPEAFHQLAPNRLPANLPEGHFWMRSADSTEWVLMRDAGAAPAPFELTVYSDAAGNTNYVLRTGDRLIQSDAITRTGTTHTGRARLPEDLTDVGANNPYNDPVTGRPWDKGHGVDHADTLEGPGVLSSTTDLANFSPQASWWNQGPRNSLVGRIRNGHAPTGRPGGGGYREMAIYSETPPVTANGTPIPNEFVFVETDAAGVAQRAWRIPNQQGAAGRAITSIDTMTIPLADVPPVMLRNVIPLAGPGGGGFYAPGMIFGMRGDRE